MYKVLSKKNYLKILITVFLTLFLHEIQSETVRTINNTDIDSLVLDIYIQSRTQIEVHLTHKRNMG